jgi:hypothetical protein
MTAVYVMSIMAFISTYDVHDTLNTDFPDDLDYLQCFSSVCDFREACHCDVRLMALVSVMPVMSMMTLTIVILIFPYFYGRVDHCVYNFCEDLGDWDVLDSFLEPVPKLLA